jgi:hypothetical protein
MSVLFKLKEHTNVFKNDLFLEFNRNLMLNFAFLKP